MERKLISSGSPFEPTIGFSRASRWRAAGERPAREFYKAAPAPSRLRLFNGAIARRHGMRVGPHIIVSGTAPIAPQGGVAAPGDLYGQTKRCLEIIEQAINEAGGRREHVVRTRMFLKELHGWENAGRAHGEFFGTIRPAATMVQIVSALDPAWLIEIEADAIVHDA